MILLDTNVVSEMMRPKPDPAVVDWLNAQDSVLLYVSAVTVAEVAYGLHSLPRGKRRDSLSRGFAHLLEDGFKGRVLDFNEAAAWRYGEVMARRRDVGRPLSALDGQIAAMAASEGFAVATRNVRDFDDCGVEIIDPFAAS